MIPKSLLQLEHMIGLQTRGRSMKKAGYQLSSAYIAYIMDPRNFLDETNIFQFQSLAYSANEVIYQESNAILKGTFMEGTKKYSTGNLLIMRTLF